MSQWGVQAVDVSLRATTLYLAGGFCGPREAPVELWAKQNGVEKRGCSIPIELRTQILSNGGMTQNGYKRT